MPLSAPSCIPFHNADVNEIHGTNHIIQDVCKSWIQAHQLNIDDLCNEGIQRLTSPVQPTTPWILLLLLALLPPRLVMLLLLSLQLLQLLLLACVQLEQSYQRAAAAAGVVHMLEQDPDKTHAEGQGM